MENVGTTYNTGRQREPTEQEAALVRDVLLEFAQMRQWRSTFESHWEEVASLIMPTMRGTFTFGNNWVPGEKKSQLQVDATGMLALARFGAICDSLLTPRNMVWHQVQSDTPQIMKDRNARLWYEGTTRTLFKHRYAPIGNFSAQNQQVYQSLGAFGTGAMFVDQAVNAAGIPIPALRYKACPIGEVFLRENHQGLVDGFIRWFRLTAGQAAKMWGAENLPAQMLPALEKFSPALFDFLHCVKPRVDYDPERLDAKGKIFASHYISIQGQVIMSEGGYNTFPLAATRYDQAPGEIYGRSPAMMALPALKTLNAQKKTLLKSAHRAADPVLLTADDGIIDVSLKPGAMNKGGVSSDGKLLVQALPTGQVNVTVEMMQEERELIKDAFLVSLFQIAVDSPQMTATEVIERTNEKGILLAPTVGRQQSEYLGPMIDRELSLLAEMRLLEPMPPAIREARGEYHVNYTSPLARAQRAQEVAGMSRTLEMTLNIVNTTQDPEPLDNFDFDTIVRDTATIQGVAESWMADPKMVQAKREKRQQMQEAQMQIQAAPSAAALMKAKAVQAKAGMPAEQQQ